MSNNIVKKYNAYEKLFHIFNREKKVEFHNQVVVFCIGMSDNSSSIHKSYLDNTLHDINLDKLIFSFLNNQIESTFVIEETKFDCNDMFEVITEDFKGDYSESIFNISSISLYNFQLTKWELFQHIFKYKNFIQWISDKRNQNIKDY